MAPQQEQPEGDVSEEEVRAQCLRLSGSDIGRGLMNPAEDIAQAQAYAAFVLEQGAMRRTRFDLLRATWTGTPEAPEKRIERARAYEAFILRDETPPEGA